MFKKLNWFAVAFAIALAATLVAAPADASVETECVSWTEEGGVDGKTPRKVNLEPKLITVEKPGPDGGDVQVTATRYREGKPLDKGNFRPEVWPFGTTKAGQEFREDEAGGEGVHKPKKPVRFRDDVARFGTWVQRKVMSYVVILELRNQPRLKIGERIAVEACVTPVDLKSCDYVLAEPVCPRDQLEEIARTWVRQYKLPSASDLTGKYDYRLSFRFSIGGGEYLLEQLQQGNVVRTGRVNAFDGGLRPKDDVYRWATENVLELDKL